MIGIFLNDSIRPIHDSKDFGDWTAVILLIDDQDSIRKVVELLVRNSPARFVVRIYWPEHFWSDPWSGFCLIKSRSWTESVIIGAA